MTFVHIHKGIGPTMINDYCRIVNKEKKKESVHVACHVCMHWAATLAFSQINLLVTEHLVAIIFQTTFWGHLGFQRTPTASEQTGNQVLAPHTEPL